ncbi:unnamed protein product [Acanthosepion pharaonis]|uniref:Uncharacterized protein n=1 Tax=Acanthosepion pharaonis TaxID=158019 RepID=A0A812DT26_ACAPH|nr:unnamed protein product [Sepia pharaonis]
MLTRSSSGTSADARLQLRQIAALARQVPAGRAARRRHGAAHGLISRAHRPIASGRHRQHRRPASARQRAAGQRAGPQDHVPPAKGGLFAPPRIAGGEIGLDQGAGDVSLRIAVADRRRHHRIGGRLEGDDHRRADNPRIHRPSAQVADRRPDLRLEQRHRLGSDRAIGMDDHLAFRSLQRSARYRQARRGADRPARRCDGRRRPYRAPSVAASPRRRGGQISGDHGVNTARARPGCPAAISSRACNAASSASRGAARRIARNQRQRLGAPPSRSSSSARVRPVRGACNSARSAVAPPPPAQSACASAISRSAAGHWCLDQIFVQPVARALASPIQAARASQASRAVPQFPPRCAARPTRAHWAGRAHPPMPRYDAARGSSARPSSSAAIARRAAAIALLLGPVQAKDRDIGPAPPADGAAAQKPARSRAYRARHRRPASAPDRRSIPPAPVAATIRDHRMRGAAPSDRAAAAPPPSRAIVRWPPGATARLRLARRSPTTAPPKAASGYAIQRDRRSASSGRPRPPALRQADRRSRAAPRRCPRPDRDPQRQPVAPPISTPPGRAAPADQGDQRIASGDDRCGRHADGARGGGGQKPPPPCAGRACATDRRAATGRGAGAIGPALQIGERHGGRPAAARS